MDSLPGSEQRGQMFAQASFDSGEITAFETVVLAQAHRAERPIQSENGLMSLANNVDVSGTMIIGLNHNPKIANPQYGRHTGDSITKPKRLGLICLRLSAGLKSRPYAPSSIRPRVFNEHRKARLVGRAFLRLVTKLRR
jgi:hypothetical protein